MDDAQLKTDFQGCFAVAEALVKTFLPLAEAYIIQCNLEGKTYLPSDFLSFLQQESDIPDWLKACASLEAAIAALTQTEAVPVPQVNYLATSSMEALGIQRFAFAENARIFEASYDVVSWFESLQIGMKVSAAEGECFALLHAFDNRVTVTPLLAAQFYLLSEITSRTMLAEAIDHFVQSHPELASTHAVMVGTWLKDWITKGIIQPI
jgi:hypothetical protein